MERLIHVIARSKYCNDNPAIIGECFKQCKHQINFRNGDRDTAINIAAYVGHANTAKCLIEHGCDVNKANQKELSPLHTAVELRNGFEIVKVLIDTAGDELDINAKNHENFTPIMYAVNGQYGWNNHSNRAKHTSAVYDSSKKEIHIRMLNYLLEKGADTEHRSGLGKHRETFLTLCKHHNEERGNIYDEIIRKLEEKGEDKLIGIEDKGEDIV